MKYVIRTISNCKIDTQWTYDTREQAVEALKGLYEMLKRYYRDSDYSRLGDFEGNGFQIMKFDIDKMVFVDKIVFVCDRRYDIYVEE